MSGPAERRGDLPGDARRHPRRADSITFETYIYWSGEIGKEFGEALSERARAGIAVSVTIDWAGSIKMDEELLSRITDAGVRIHRYRPLHWYNLGRINNRTHRKLLVVDGKVGFTGGVGIADQWRGQRGGSRPLARYPLPGGGTVVAQIQAAFNDNWIKTTGEVLHGAEYFPCLATAGTMAAHLFVASPAGGGESMHLMYLLSIAAAKRPSTCTRPTSSRTSSPARRCWPRGARRTGAGTGSRTPHRFRGGPPQVPGEWGALLAAGVEICEYEPTMLHAKLLVIDQGFVSVGSTNFDSRSFRLNDEASLNVHDRVCERHDAVFEEDSSR